MDFKSGFHKLLNDLSVEDEIRDASIISFDDEHVIIDAYMFTSKGFEVIKSSLFPHGYRLISIEGTNTETVMISFERVSL